MTRRKVMVVDDDQTVCELVARTLTKAGFDVETALSGEEGLARLAAFEPACLVVDKVLPGLGGLELMIEARRRRPGLPVVLISGHPEPFQLGEGRPDAVVLKPFGSLKALGETVSAVLDSSGFEWPLAQLRERVAAVVSDFTPAWKKKGL
jgi:CheY-like chemotaxis protein